MFEGKKFITRGVQDKIPPYLQLMLWYMVEIMVADTKNPFQTFELSEATGNGRVQQKICHSQECPDYKKEYHISAKSAVNAKVYIIDDGEHCTMLLSEEY